MGSKEVLPGYEPLIILNVSADKLAEIEITSAAGTVTHGPYSGSSDVSDLVGALTADVTLVARCVENVIEIIEVGPNSVKLSSPQTGYTNVTQCGFEYILEGETWFNPDVSYQNPYTDEFVGMIANLTPGATYLVRSFVDAPDRVYSPIATFQCSPAIEVPINPLLSYQLSPAAGLVEAPSGEIEVNGGAPILGLWTLPSLESYVADDLVEVKLTLTRSSVGTTDLILDVALIQDGPVIPPEYAPLAGALSCARLYTTLPSATTIHTSVNQPELLTIFKDYLRDAALSYKQTPTLLIGNADVRWGVLVSVGITLTVAG